MKWLEQQPFWASGPGRKQFYSGTHRVMSPEETLERVRPFLRAIGVTRVANVTGLDRIGIPVVMVCRPNSRALSVSQGKGLDLPAAKASGLMETLESYHAERVCGPIIFGSYDELRDAYTLLDVQQLPRPTGSRFHDQLPLPWIQGYDLLQEEPVWAPFELVHTNYTIPVSIDRFTASSNGLASGNHLLEAICQGICEVVERDCSAQWSCANNARREAMCVDLDSVEDADCRAVLDKFDAAEMAVGVWETTHDCGIPAFECIIVDRCTPKSGQPAFAAGGAGCHPAREIALFRSLSEAAQSRLTLIAGSRDDMPLEVYREAMLPSTVDLFRRVVESAGGGKPIVEVRSSQHETFAEDIDWILSRLRIAGLTRVAVFDLTRADIGIPVVRVVIPGMDYGAHSDLFPVTRRRRFQEQLP